MSGTSVVSSSGVSIKTPVSAAPGPEAVKRRADRPVSVS